MSVFDLMGKAYEAITGKPADTTAPSDEQQQDVEFVTTEQLKHDLAEGYVHEFTFYDDESSICTVALVWKEDDAEKYHVAYTCMHYDGKPAQEMFGHKEFTDWDALLYEIGDALADYEGPIDDDELEVMKNGHQTGNAV